MGLDTSHDAWSGGYGTFYQWRRIIAHAAGLPPLDLMEGFYSKLVDGISILPTLYSKDNSSFIKAIDERLPIKWECLKRSPLHILLSHSDCDGDIKWRKCKGIADELEKLLPLIPVEKGHPEGDYWLKKTQKFIDGLRLAYEKKENLEFH
jgi:hypothetical protein